MTDFHASTPDGEVHLASAEEGKITGPDDLLRELAESPGDPDPA